MSNNFEDVVFQIQNSDNKLIILVGYFDEFTAHNLARDNNYSILDFDDFLRVNNIDSNHFKGSDANRTQSINISIDKWTQKIAFAEQKSTIIVDGFTPQKLHDYLTKSLLMQELLYLSKNSSRLKANLVFVINLKNGSLRDHILPKITENCNIINFQK